MSLAESARNNAVSFEVKKDGLTQRQSGDWVLRVTVQAIDMHQRIVNAAMGARFACVLVEINDDEAPVEHAAIERDKWRELGPARQAGILCKQPTFWSYLREVKKFPVTDEIAAAAVVRSLCGVDSRAELGKPGKSVQRMLWYDLNDAFQAWRVLERG